MISHSCAMLVYQRVSTIASPFQRNIAPDSQVLSDLALAHELQLSSQEAEAEANQLSSEQLEETGDDGIPLFLICL